MILCTCLYAEVGEMTVAILRHFIGLKVEWKISDWLASLRSIAVGVNIVE